MKKITLILIALITVACSDPEDKYIVLECTETLEASPSFGEVSMLIMDEDAKTFETYFPKSTVNEEGPIIFPISGTYTEEGDHHYLYTWGLESTQKLLAKQEYLQEIYESYAEIGKQAPPPQFKFDRRDFSYSYIDYLSIEKKGPYNDVVWTDYINQDCKVIDVPEDYLASKKNKDVNLF